MITAAAAMNRIRTAPVRLRQVRSFRALGAGALLFLGGVTAALADVVVLTSVADNTLYQDPNGALSNGAGSAMFAGTNSASQVRRAVLRFDVAGGLPADAIVTSATLTLYNDAANAGPASVALHRLTRAWGEGASVASGGQGGGAPAAPGDATWIHTNYPTSFWAAAGGDFLPSVSAATIVSGPGFYSWNGLAAEVQSFLEAPGANFGWIGMGDEVAASSGKRFATREATTAGHSGSARRCLRHADCCGPARGHRFIKLVEYPLIFRGPAR